MSASRGRAPAQRCEAVKCRFFLSVTLWERKKPATSYYLNKVRVEMLWLKEARDQSHPISSPRGPWGPLGTKDTNQNPLVHLKCGPQSFCSFSEMVKTDVGLPELLGRLKEHIKHLAYSSGTVLVLSERSTGEMS